MKTSPAWKEQLYQFCQIPQLIYVFSTKTPWLPPIRMTHIERAVGWLDFRAFAAISEAVARSLEFRRDSIAPSMALSLVGIDQSQ